MFVLDFTSTRRKAFAHGFLKGLAAPAYLYHLEEAPSLPPVMMVTPPRVSAADALAHDWLAIGGDMKKVIEQHGQAYKALQKHDHKRG
jgi:hypothetical protein